MRFKDRGVLAAIILLAMTGQASAATKIWKGGAGNSFWSTPGNWQGNAAPQAGDSLVFPAGAPGTTVNNFAAGTEFASLTFQASGYSVDGNQILLVDGITIEASNSVVTISCAIQMKGVLLGIFIPVTFHVSTGGTLFVDGAITGSASVNLRKTGPGTLTLVAGNGYHGPTSILEGVLRIGHVAALGSAGSSTFVTTGAALEAAVPGNGSIAEPITLAGEGVPNVNDGALSVIDSVTLTGPITLTGTPAAMVFVVGNADLTIAGQVGGATGLALNGPGRLIFTGAGNTYTGPTTVLRGTMVLGKVANAIPAGLIVGDGVGNALTDVVRLTANDQIAGPVTVASSGWLDLGNFRDEVPGLSMSGGQVSSTAAGQLVLGGDVTVDLTGPQPAVIQGHLSLGTASRTFSVTGSTVFPAMTISATIQGGAAGAGLIKTGLSFLHLAGANTYDGPTTVSEGGVVVGHAQGLGLATAGTTVTGDAAVLFTVSVPNEPLSAQTDGDDPVLYYTGAGVGIWGGPIVLQTDSVFAAQNGTALRLNGDITGGGGLLIAADSGFVELGGSANTYSGGTLVAGGLRLNGGHRLPDTGLVFVQGTLDLNGFPETIGGLDGIAAAKVTLGAGTLTVDIPEDRTSSFAGVISGSGGVTKYGAGRLELSNAQTYTGPTFVTGGTLVLQQGGAIPGTVTVGDATFRGIGSVGKLLAVYARIEPGLSPGVLTAGELTLADDSTLAIEIDGSAAGTQHDQIKVTGPIDLAAGKLELLLGPNLSLSASSPLVIISNDTPNPIAGGFGDLFEGDTITAGGRSFTLTFKGGDGNDVALIPGARHYYLSEGATGSFFDLDILIANPNDSPAPITLTFLLPGGATIVEHVTIGGLQRLTTRVDELAGLADTAVSTIVTSDTGLPIVVERTMRWDQSGYGAHTEKAASATSLNWYFAEGSQGFFSTYLLLANPQDTENVATVRYLRENAPAIVRTYPIAPKSRFTVDAGTDPDLVNFSFGMHVTFDAPGAAERAMYFGSDPFWKGGHESAGVTAPSTTWLLAEGATGAFFETFILLSNPSGAPAETTVTFLPSTGVPVTKTYPVAPLGRVTINIEGEDPSLVNAAVATQVVSSQPILVERAQYWPDPAPQWYEAHNSFGVTAAGTKWGLAEGRVGGSPGYQTYILLANPESTDAEVTITFLRENGAAFTKTFIVGPKSRFNVDTGPGTLVPELTNENFGAVVVSTTPIAVERAMYANVNGQTWAAGTNATATALP